jgi:anti-anti-sigma factor
VDSTGIGLLIRLHKKARITGRQIILVSPGPAVKSALKMMRLHDFFCIAPDAFRAQKQIEAPDRQNPVLLRQNYFPSKPALFWRGEVTAANVDHVWEITQTHIESRRNSKEPVQIDISSLEFIDSAGIGLMLRTRKCANARGTKLRFVGTRPNVQSILRLSKLDSLLLKND